MMLSPYTANEIDCALMEQYTHCDNCVKSDVCQYKDTFCFAIEKCNDLISGDLVNYITVNLKCKYYIKNDFLNIK